MYTDYKQTERQPERIMEKEMKCVGLDGNGRAGVGRVNSG